MKVHTYLKMLIVKEGNVKTNKFPKSLFLCKFRSFVCALSPLDKRLLKQV